MIEAAATVGNFGAGFDVFSLALEGAGDSISITSADQDHIVLGGPDADVIPLDWHRNIAGLVVDALRAKTNLREPVGVAIDKGQPSGSGLGSSASSAAGTALAFYQRHPDVGLELNDLVQAALMGESAASGGNADDIAAVLVGGLAIAQETDAGYNVRRFDPPDNLHIAVAAPDMHLPTEEMRAMLPKLVPRRDAIWNLGQAAALLHAFTTGDIPGIGAALEDRLAIPYRAPRIPYLARTVAAAVDAGAHGGCLSGSGPAVIGICDAPGVAKEAAAAMAEAVESTGTACRQFTARPQMENPYAILH